MSSMWETFGVVWLNISPGVYITNNEINAMFAFCNLSCKNGSGTIIYDIK